MPCGTIFNTQATSLHPGFHYTMYTHINAQCMHYSAFYMETIAKVHDMDSFAVSSHQLALYIPSPIHPICTHTSVLGSWPQSQHHTA